MKRLVMVRHAKAEGHFFKPDYERKLKGRGKKDARNMARILQKEHGIIPNAMISSPAPRALETAEIYADILQFPKVSIQREIELYDGITTKEFIQLIRATDESVKTLMVFGHNPHMSIFTGNLLPVFYDDMPTCSSVSIAFEVDDWNDIEPQSGQFEFHEYPRLYRIS